MNGKHGARKTNETYGRPSGQSGSNERSIGSNRVQMSWHKGTGTFAKDPDSGEEYEVRVEGLPAKYNTGSELQVTISSEDNRYDFDLKTKSGS